MAEDKEQGLPLHIGWLKDLMTLARKHYRTICNPLEMIQFLRPREHIVIENPGSTLLLKTKLQGDDQIFERLYVCFAQFRKGFIEECKTTVGFDGAFIKGQHPGQILSAAGINATNDMFPIAFVVGETKSRAIWTWFLEIFFNDIGIKSNIRDCARQLRLNIGIV